MQKWLSVARARKLILDGVVPVVQSEKVAVRDALGRVLARDIIAPFNVPAFDNSAMDGFACRFEDIKDASNTNDAPNTKTALAIIGEAFAGRPCAKTPGRGECIKIMTGAPIPAGADIVVPVEETRTMDNSQIAILPATNGASFCISALPEKICAKMLLHFAPGSCVVLHIWV